MKLIHRSSIILVLISVLALTLGVACATEEQGPAEELGEKFDEFVDDVQDEGDDLGDELKEAGEELKEGAEEVKDEIDGGGNG